MPVVVVRQRAAENHEHDCCEDVPNSLANESAELWKSSVEVAEYNCNQQDQENAADEV